MLYLDLNPKRARKVSHPQKNTWSSYAYYAHGKSDPLITPALVYLELGQTPKERQSVYQSMVEEILKNDWKEKKPYSSIPFIGNPQWVKNRSEKLKTEQWLKTFEWKTRYNQKFSPQNHKIKNLV